MNFFKFASNDVSEGATSRTNVRTKSFVKFQHTSTVKEISEGVISKGTERVISKGVISKGNEQVISEGADHSERVLVTEISSTSDILYIDYIIRTNFSILTKDDIIEEINRCKWIKENSTNPTDIKIAKTQLNVLNSKLLDTENNFELIYYIMITDPILNEYKKIKSIEQNFIKREGVDLTKKKKTELSLEYLRIARNYIKLKNEQVYINKITCPCGSIDFYITEEDFYSCVTCGSIIELLDNTPNFKDIDRVNMSVRYKYTEEGNFIVAMNEFECIQNSSIPDNVFTLINNEIKANSISLESLTRQDIYMFLSDNNLSMYYSDINLLYYSIKNIKSPVITPYRDGLLAEFRIVQKADKELKNFSCLFKQFKSKQIIDRDFEYQKLKPETVINGVKVHHLLLGGKYSLLQERTSSRSINFILYKLLQRIKFSCKKEDLSFLKTNIKIMEHLEWWQIICEYLGWKYTEV